MKKAFSKMSVPIVRIYKRLKQKKIGKKKATRYIHESANRDDTFLTLLLTLFITLSILPSLLRGVDGVEAGTSTNVPVVERGVEGSDLSLICDIDTRLSRRRSMPLCLGFGVGVEGVL